VTRIYNLVSFNDIQQQAVESYSHTKPFIVALGRFTEVKPLEAQIKATKRMAY
jgi:hypothetical protein